MSGRSIEVLQHYLRRLCDERNLLLMFDEVQCGVGRTGEFCGFKVIAPDVNKAANGRMDHFTRWDSWRGRAERTRSG